MNDWLEGYWGVLNENPLQLLYDQYQLFYKQKTKFSAAFGTKFNDQPILYALFDSTAVVEIIGPITTYDDAFNQFFGIPSIEKIREAIQTALDDSQVSNILLKIDSPGGIATGFSELTDFVFEAGKEKEINSWATMCCSAAFFLAAATRKIYTTPMGIVGSIGVIHSQYQSNDELLVTVSQNAPFKSKDASTEKGREKILAVINDLERTFLEKLSEYRQIPQENIIQHWGQGSEITGAQALKVNMVDDLIGYHELLSSLTRRHSMATKRTQMESSKDADSEFKQTFSDVQNAEIQQIVAQALEQQAKAHSVQIQQIRDEQSEKDTAESKRKSAIQSLFAIFNNEIMYRAQYQELLAQCLADIVVTESEARQRVIQLRSTLSYQTPPTEKMAESGSDSDKSLRTKQDFQQIVAELKKSGLSHTEATVKAVRENPEAHKAMLGQHNDGIQIDWTQEQNLRG